MYLTFCFRLGWAGVASLMVGFLGVSCYSGQWIFRLSVSWPCVGLFFVRVSLWGSWGAAWLLDSFSGLLWATGHGGRGMGKMVDGSFCWGLRLFGSESWALVISDYK